MIGKVSENFVRNSCLSVTKEGEYLRVVWSKSVPLKGFEKVKKDGRQKKEVEEGRFDSSISRTKSTVRQYARCNEWDYFVTLTISPEKWDRFDLREFYRSFGKYLSNLNSRRTDGKKLLYMLVPEQHASGAWHFHGLMYGLPENWLHKLSIGDRMNHNQADNVKAGKDVYIQDDIAKKYGWNDFQPIRSHEAISLYITKYITKDALTTQLPKGYRFILASTGLKKAKSLRKMYGVAMNMCKGLFEYDYVSEDGNTAIYTIKPDKKYEYKFLSDLDILFKEEKK